MYLSELSLGVSYNRMLRNLLAVLNKPVKKRRKYEIGDPFPKTHKIKLGKKEIIYVEQRSSVELNVQIYKYDFNINKDILTFTITVQTHSIVIDYTVLNKEKYKQYFRFGDLYPLKHQRLIHSAMQKIVEHFELKLT